MRTNLRSLSSTLGLVFSALLFASCGATGLDNGGDGGGPDGPPANIDGGCGVGTTACGGLCVNLLSDAAHCGACNTACMPGQFCVASKCQSSPTCPPGLVSCNGTCTDVQSSPQNC